MNKLLIAALAAASAATLASPSAAQPYGYRSAEPGWSRDRDYRDRDYRDDDRGEYREGWRRGDPAERHERQIARRIDDAARRGLLSGREYSKVTRGLEDIRYAHSNFYGDGVFDRRERAEIDRRLRLLEYSLESRINNAEYARR